MGSLVSLYLFSIFFGENLRVDEREKFLLCVKEPLEKALEMFAKITKIKIALNNNNKI